VKHSYLIEPLANLLSVHPNTVHQWIKAGLPRMDNAYPHVVYGEQVIAFLNERQRSKKITLAVEEFYCCKCQVPRTAWEGLAELHIRTSKTGNLKAVCEHCGTGLHKMISLAKIGEFEKRLTLLTSPLVQPTNNSANRETKGAQNHVTL
jgi:hypothetical protein